MFQDKKKISFAAKALNITCILCHKYFRVKIIYRTILKQKHSNMLNSLQLTLSNWNSGLASGNYGKNNHINCVIHFHA